METGYISYTQPNPSDGTVTLLIDLPITDIGSIGYGAVTVGKECRLNKGSSVNYELSDEPLDEDGWTHLLIRIASKSCIKCPINQNCIPYQNYRSNS